MALADIYVLDHAQEFGTEPLHNIYCYEKLGEGDAYDLINAFQADILPSVLALQVNTMVTRFISAYSLGNLADLAEETINAVGSYGADQMLPVFNAVNLTLKPTSRAVRPGSKRVSGIPETVTGNGIITDAEYLGRIETLRLAFGNEISTDDENFWRLVIVKRVKYNPDPEKPDHFAYRFPETDGELVVAPLRNVTTTTRVSHQVSRGN